ncbi:MAG: DUF2007 domain-containing protein [Chloracidobacterium sp.]|nr:DUF2007 domain-containing protein [Chloracidobacterium sp.]
MSVNEDSDQEGMFVTLAHFAKSIEAEMARELLANNGIDAVLNGASSIWLEPLVEPGGFSRIQLLVPDFELERARQLYDAFFGGVQSLRALDGDEW